MTAMSYLANGIKVNQEEQGRKMLMPNTCREICLKIPEQQEAGAAISVSEDLKIMLFAS